MVGKKMPIKNSEKESFIELDVSSVQIHMPWINEGGVKVRVKFNKLSGIFDVFGVLGADKLVKVQILILKKKQKFVQVPMWKYLVFESSVGCW